jgi:F-type H+-transporting ATPase subunit epsilon
MAEHFAEGYQHGTDVTTGMRLIECAVVTPEATVYSKYATFVVVPLFDGELGVGPGHSPFIGRLGYGEMRIMEGDETHRFYIEGGFVECVGNELTVLTQRAVQVDKLDATVAQQQLTAAQAREAHSEEAISIRDRMEAMARAQLRLAGRPAVEPVGAKHK